MSESASWLICVSPYQLFSPRSLETRLVAFFSPQGNERESEKRSTFNNVRSFRVSLSSLGFDICWQIFLDLCVVISLSAFHVEI